MLVPFVAPTTVTPTAGAAESKAAALRAAKSRPWILHNYCRLCDCEASDSHLLGNRHAKKTQAAVPWSPMCWKADWFPVPLDYLPSQVPASLPAPSDAAPPPPPADVHHVPHVYHSTRADVDFRPQHVEQYLVALTSASSSTTTSVHISTATNVPAPALDSRPSHLLRPKASSTAPPSPSPTQHRQPGGMPIGAPIGFLAGGASPARRRSRSHGRQSRRAP